MELLEEKNQKNFYWIKYKMVEKNKDMYHQLNMD
jgi:hypothetical protein